MKFLKGLLVVLVCAVLLTGCTGEKNVEGSLEEIMTKLYADVPEENRPMMLENMEVTEENVEGFLGTNEIEYKEALASESMTGSIAHSIVLVRTKENANVENVKKQIQENVDPRKWVCVSVEKEDVIIKSKGDLIVVIIVEDPDVRAKIDNSFEKL